MRLPTLTLICAIAAAGVGCAIAAEDRCSEGQIFDENVGGCTGAGTLGDPCESNEDCSLAAEICLPTLPGQPGICTVAFCASGADCGTPAFGCCACPTGEPLPVPLCVPVTSTTTFAAAGCGCS